MLHSALGAGSWLRCLLNLGQVAPATTERDLLYPRTIARTRDFLNAFPEPEASPFLRTFFPESFQPTLDREHLVMQLATWIATLPSRTAEVRLGGLVSAFFGSVMDAQRLTPALRNSPHFRDFLRTECGAPCAELPDHPQLTSFLGQPEQTILDQLHRLYRFDGIIAQYPDDTIVQADATARQFLGTDATLVLRYLGLIHQYRRHLVAQRSWDSALALTRREWTEDSYPAENLLGITLYVGAESYELQTLIGTGSENYVFRVRNRATGATRILKITVQPLGAGGTSTLHRRIEAAGIPIVRMEYINERMNFVEEISYFGSNAVDEYLVDRNETGLNQMIEFYRHLISTSPLRIQDLTPNNVGRRADGTWVITDWAFNLYFQQTNDPLEGRISTTEIGTQLIRGVLSRYEALVRDQRLAQPVARSRAIELVDQLLDRLRLPRTNAYQEFLSILQRTSDNR